jgi:hypothetical protein
MLGWPTWGVILSCLGWFPGAVLFPLGIGLWTEPVTWSTFLHFVVSFALCGLIALTYSFFFVQFVVLRVLYSRLWADVQDLRPTIQRELHAQGPRLRWFQVLAGAIPLAGALLILILGSDVTGGDLFRWLSAGLILLGIAGFVMAVAVNKVLVQTLSLYEGPLRKETR